ncbi:DinB family protein [Thermomonospora umbrina]|uniref:Uncharacterized protein DUF664 n=1 Tax=Thermomonospora umbrina TaxID=111806 RepID=A0A3D9T3L9_9ACTN|nr:DinB family protein [Thermomonospora umbrina]REE98401.1 uncharacterized protein DUF664 [Thermomonospora umbrina]
MTWSFPESPRTDEHFAASVGDERAVADAWLDHHRRVLLWKCGGLTAEQLKLRCVEPSNLSLLGLLRHMAEVERDWFRNRFAGQDVGHLYCTDANMNAEFDDVDGADTVADHAVYLREVDLARRAVAGRSLDEVFLDPYRKVEMSLRWVYSVMIQEYARHNGHADLLRERIDGTTGH